MITIEFMNYQHVSAIAELEKQCFSMPWDESSIASELQNPLSLWLVAMDDGHLAGYIGSQSVLGESDMMNVAVFPAYRRRGIGRMLVSQLVQHLREKGNRSLTLEVRASNAGAIALYESMGFVQVGLRKTYYRNPREDAWILRKEWEL